MRRTILLTVILLGLGCATAQARLSMARGHAAITRYEHRYNGTVGSCWRDRRAVYCHVSGTAIGDGWAGWHFQMIDVATLHASAVHVRTIGFVH